MARLKPRSRFYIPLLITVLGVSIYYTRDIEQSTSTVSSSEARKPNAFATGTKLKEFNETGELQLEIETASSYYFRREQLIETTAPRIRYKNENDEFLNLDAVKGSYLTDQGILELNNEVTLSRVDDSGRALKIEAEDLQIDTQNDFISTSRKVKITQDQHALISEGLKASLNDRKIELPQRVRGIYDLSN